MSWDDQLVNDVAKNENQFINSQNERTLTYVEALNEALRLSLDQDERVFVLGQGVNDPSAMFGTTKNLKEKFGEHRILETPLSEDALTGLSVGAAMNGMRPVYMHNRPDFLLLTFNQIVSHASKFSFMSNGQTKVPLVMWSAIGRGWGTGAQHSQAIQGLLVGVPGLKIIMPRTPYDAKGLLLSAIEDNNPVLIFEHRWLMKRKGFVPEEYYTIPLGKAQIVRSGNDLTIIGSSLILDEALEAAHEIYETNQIDCEVIDLRTIQPFDEETVLASVKKTGKVLVVDTGWIDGGVTSHLSVKIYEKAFSFLKMPIERIALPHCPTPSSSYLESEFYPGIEDILKTIKKLAGTP